MSSVRNKISGLGNAFSGLAGKLGGPAAGIASAAGGITSGLAGVEAAGSAAATGILAVGAAAAASVAAVAAIGAAAGVVGKQFYDLGSEADALNDKLAIKTGGSQAEIDKLKTSIEKLGTTNVPLSFDKIGDVAVDVTRNLKLTGPALEEVTSRLANLGRMGDEAVNVKALGDAFKQLNVTDPVAAINELNKLSQQTGLSFNTLAQSLDSSAAALSNSGLSFSESAGLLSQLAAAGVDAQEVLLGITKLLREAPKLGMDGQTALKKVVDEIQALSAQGPAGEQQAKELADKLFGRGSLKLFDAIKRGAIDLNNLKITGPIEDVNDLSKRTADWSERWQILQSTIKKALEPLGTKVFDAVNAQLGKLADWVTAHQADIINFFVGFGKVVIDAGVFIAQSIGDVVSTFGQLGQVLGDIQGGMLKFQAWQADIRGDTETAAELRRQSEEAFGFGESLTKIGDAMKAADGTAWKKALDDAGAAARGAATDTNTFGTELGALPTDGVNIPITADTSAADAALNSMFEQYKQLTVSVNGEPGTGLAAGTLLGAGVDPTGVRGNVSGVNLSTVGVSAQKFANDCIDASARIVLSVQGIGKTEEQLMQVIAPGGSISSLADGLNKLNPQGKYVAMEGSGGSPEALFKAVKDSIDKGVGSVLNVAPGSTLAGHTFAPGHFIAVTGYDASTGQINLSDTADGTVYSVSAGDAFQASRGRGIVAGTGAGQQRPTSSDIPGVGSAAGLPNPVRNMPQPATQPPNMPQATTTPTTPVPPAPAVKVAPVEVQIIPTFTTPTGDPVTDSLQAQLDAANNTAKAAAASKKATDAAQAVADAAAAAQTAQTQRDTVYSSDLLYTAADRAKADADLLKSTQALTDAQNAQADSLTEQQRTNLQDQISTRQQATAPMDYTKLPLGDPRRIAAQAFMGAGGTAEEFAALMGGNAGPAAQQVTSQAVAAAAQPIGQAAGNAAADAINTNLLPTATPTAPDTSTNQLLAERNPAVVAKLAGLNVPDYTRQGGDPGAVMTNTGPGFNALGQMTSDTAAMIDRTLTSMEAANRARQDQLLSILQQIKDQVGSKVVGPIVEASTTAALSGIAADIGTAMGETAGPIIGEKTAAAVDEKVQAQQSSSGTSAIPGMAGGGGIYGGTPGKDSVPAMLMPGEYVLTTADVARMGGFAGVERFIGGMQANGRIQYFATGGGVGRATTGNPNGGQNVNSTVGADFFGVSQIPVLALAINALTEVLLKVIGVEIMQRDAMIEVSKDLRDFRGDFKAFDAAGRIKNDNSGLVDRTSSSEKQAADERIRILKMVIDGIVKYAIEKIIVPLGKAIGNAIVSALAGAAGGAISGGGGSIAGGIASAAISAAGAVAIDIAAEIFTIASETLITIGLDVIGEFLQTLFPNLTTSLLGGAVMEQIAGPVSAVMTNAIGFITSAVGNLMGNLGGLFAGFIPTFQGFLAGFAPLTLSLSAIVGVLSSVAAVLQQILAALVALGAGIAAPIVAAVSSVLGGFTSLSVSMAGITGVLASVAAVLQQLFGGLASLGNSIAAPIVAAVSSVLSGFASLNVSMAGIATVLSSIAAILQQIFGSLFNLGSGIASPIVSAVTSALSGFMPLVSNLNTTTNALGGVASVLTGLAPNLSSVVSSFGVTGAALSTAMGGIATLANAVNPPKATVNPVAAAAASTVSTVNQLTAALASSVTKPTTNTTVNAPITVVSATTGTATKIATKLLSLTG